MTAFTSVIRGPKTALIKTRNLARTMTTGTLVATLPKGSRILSMALSGVASNAGTTATIGIGTTAAANQLATGVNVLAAGQGNGVTPITGVAGAMGSVLTVDTPIYFIYAETGAASSAGAWVVHIKYTTGNILDNDTTN